MLFVFPVRFLWWLYKIQYLLLRTFFCSQNSSLMHLVTMVVLTSLWWFWMTPLSHQTYLFENKDKQLRILIYDSIRFFQNLYNDLVCIMRKGSYSYSRQWKNIHHNNQNNLKDKRPSITFCWNRPINTFFKRRLCIFRWQATPSNIYKDEKTSTFFKVFSSL